VWDEEARRPNTLGALTAPLGHVSDFGVNQDLRQVRCATCQSTKPEKSNGGSMNEPSMFEDSLGVQSTFCVP